MGYGFPCTYNLRQRDPVRRAPLLRILAIAVLVQFSWEAVLAMSGIRNRSLDTIVVNSLLETNMGLPYFYLIHRLVARIRDDQLTPVRIDEPGRDPVLHPPDGPSAQ